MMTIFRSILLLVLLLTSTAELFGQPTGKFKRKVKKYQLQFFMPAGYDNVPVIKNPQLPNDYAISKIEEDFEIRYQIRTLEKEIKTYKKNLKNPTLKLIHPNYLWKTEVKTRINSLASTDQKTPELREFSEEAFEGNFVGDGGGLCFYNLSESTNLGYKYAITMVVHRNFVADLYITFLGNEKDKLQENSLSAFHAMGFVK